MWCIEQIERNIYRNVNNIKYKSYFEFKFVCSLFVVTDIICKRNIPQNCNVKQQWKCLHQALTKNIHIIVFKNKNNFRTYLYLDFIMDTFMLELIDYVNKEAYYCSDKLVTWCEILWLFVASVSLIIVLLSVLMILSVK